MTQKLTITFNEDNPQVILYGRPARKGQTFSLVGDFTASVQEINPRAYAEVVLLDAEGTAPERPAPSAGPWTYANPDGLAVGTYVFVPFGPYDASLIGKIVTVSPEPVYEGFCRIKSILGQAMLTRDWSKE